MSFLDKVPTYIVEIEDEITKLNRKRLDIDWGHECDCEYCDRQNEGGEEAEQLADEIDKDIHAKQSFIKKLKAYINMFPEGEES
jgi:hypothetical protein